MPTSYPLISIPKPCNVGWENMTPNERGAHCSVCNKTVWDFTNKTPDEIKDIFGQQAGNNPCGRFRRSQLMQRGDVELPLHLLAEMRMSPLSRFAIIALIVFGASLFSFANAEAQEAVKVVVQDTLSTPTDSGHVMPVLTDAEIDSINNKYQQMPIDEQIVAPSINRGHEEFTVGVSIDILYPEPSPRHRKRR